MSQSKTLNQNLDEFLRMHIEFANSGENEALSDENQAIIILNSLPETYREVKTAIKYGRTSITLEEVISALKSKDLEMKTEKGGSSSGELNLSRGRPTQRKPWHGRGRSQSRSHSRGPSKGYNNIRGRSTSKGPQDTEGCYNCGKPGHFKRDCYFLNRNRKHKYNGQRDNHNSESQDFKHKTDHQSANLSDGYENGEVYVAGSSFKDDWILDSGCTFHMTNNRSFLTDFRDSTRGKVILGNDQSCAIEGSGTVAFKMHDGITRSLTGVRYVPDLSRNLISLSVLDDMQIESKIKEGQMKICKGSMTIMKGIKKEGLYYLVGEPIYRSNNTVGQNDVLQNPEDAKAILWHNRLGHIAEKGLQIVSEQQLLGKDKVR